MAEAKSKDSEPAPVMTLPEAKEQNSMKEENARLSEEIDFVKQNLEMIERETTSEIENLRQNN